MRFRRISFFVLSAAAISACGQAPGLSEPNSAVPAVSPAATLPAAAGSPATASPAGSPSVAPALRPYQTARLVDVRNGNQFTLAGFGGKIVIVEGMASW